MNNFYQTFFVSGNALLWFSMITLIYSFYLHAKEQQEFFERSRACLSLKVTFTCDINHPWFTACRLDFWRFMCQYSYYKQLNSALNNVTNLTFKMSDMSEFGFDNVSQKCYNQI